MEYRRRDYYLFKFIYFVRYFADCMFYAYTSLYLTSIGLKEGIIGTITSLTTLVPLVVGPIWGLFAKNTKVIRILLFILSMIEGSVIIIYGNVSVVEGIMLLTALGAMASLPYYGMMDGYSEGYCDAYGKDYSKIRIMGSLAYLVATFFCGLWIEKIGFTVSFSIAGALFIIAGAFSFLLPKMDKKNEPKRNYRVVLKNKLFWVYVACYLCFAILPFLIDSYNSVFFTKNLGLSISSYSYIYIGALAVEVLVMFLMSRFCRNVPFIYLLFIGGIAYALKNILMGIPNIPLGFSIAFLYLRGVAWGLILFVHIKNIAKIVGVENTTSAALILSSCTCLFSFLMYNLVGYAIEGFGYSFVYFVVGFIVLCATFLYFFVMRFHKTVKKKQNE